MSPQILRPDPVGEYFVTAWERHRASMLRVTEDDDGVTLSR